MGLSEYLENDVVSRHSASESDRFGFATDRITVGTGAIADAERLVGTVGAIERAMAASTATVTILRYPSEALSLVRDVAWTDVALYPAGTLVYWQGPALADQPDIQPDIRQDGSMEVLPRDRQRFSADILAVLRDSFHDYVNHYSANPLIEPGVVVEGYAEWAASTMSHPDNRVFAVAASGGEAIAVAVVAVVGGDWEIELASVAGHAQRQGHYATLIRRVTSAAKTAGAERVIISTQAHNIGVQRAWAKLGFVPIAAIDTVHVVARSAL